MTGEEWTILPYTLESGRVRAVLSRQANGLVVEKTFGWRDEIESWCRADGITAKVLPTITEAEYLKQLEAEWEATEAQCPEKPKRVTRSVSGSGASKFLV